MSAHTDICTNITIIGSGPAGAVTSLFLSKNKIHHTILDKAIFPRDKICGDGLSGKVVSVIKKLDPSLIDDLKNREDTFLGSWGVMFVAPNGKKLEIPFKKDLSGEPHPAGFVAKRADFDFFLYEKTKTPFAKHINGAEVKKLVRNKEGIGVTYEINGQLCTFNSKIVIGADGEKSITEKTFFNYPLEPKHFYAGVRAYYKGVTGLHPLNFIELHFLKELLPGYFWIFPLPNGQANVGVCILSAKARDNKLNLREIMLKIIEKEPGIANRFTLANAESKIMGWGLPLGSKKRNFSSDHVLLTGDAASLIDPFTGEGIGNALYSGMIASQAAQSSLLANNFSKEYFREHYDRQIEKGLRDELNLSYTMQKLCKKPWLFNFVASKSEKNVTLRETISCMFEDLDMRARLRDPRYYFKLLFNR